MSNTLTHFDARGRPIMVDVSEKPPTERYAKAVASITMSEAALEQALSGEAKKGDVCKIAQLAGIMGGKQTSTLIPLCHNLPLSALGVQIEAEPELFGLRVTAEARTTGQTGVEMEAMTAVSIACLTIYDMLKSIDRDMEISSVRLLEKSGGKSGHWTRNSTQNDSSHDKKPFST